MRPFVVEKPHKDTTVFVINGVRTVGRDARKKALLTLFGNGAVVLCGKVERFVAVRFDRGKQCKNYADRENCRTDLHKR